MNKEQFIEKLKNTPIDECEGERQDNLFDLINDEWTNREIDTLYNFIMSYLGYGYVFFKLENDESSEYTCGDDMIITCNYLIDSIDDKKGAERISGLFNFGEVPMYYNSADEVIETLLDVIGRVERINKKLK